MERVRVFHVGDIHFPEGRVDSGSDEYDAGMMANAQIIAPYPLEAVAKDLYEQAQRYVGTRVLAVCGDLTSRGDKDYYRAAVAWFSEAMQLEGWDVPTLMVVPGNHDVSRPDVEHPEEDKYKKFDHLDAAWRDQGLPVLDCRHLRVNTIQQGAASVILASLNSCLMCGSYRPIPDTVADEMHKLVDAESNAGENTTLHTIVDAVFSTAAEQVDAPGVANEHLQQLNNVLQNAGPETVAVILAHHNALPQYRPRINIYPELVNAGALRETLVRSQTPAVYLHGHVHNDPVETVEDHSADGLQACFIAAPELRDGYNIVDVVLAQSGHLLGLEVRPVRLIDGSIRHRGTAIARIRLLHLPQDRKTLVRDLIALLPRNRELRFQDVLDAAYQNQFNPRQENEVAELLMEGMWMTEISISYSQAYDSPQLEDQDPHALTFRVL